MFVIRRALPVLLAEQCTIINVIVLVSYYKASYCGITNEQFNKSHEAALNSYMRFTHMQIETIIQKGTEFFGLTTLN